MAGFFNKPSGAIILLYHRIGTPKDDPHLLSVSPKNFEAQLIALKQKLKPLSMVQIVKAIRRGKTPSGFAITFDDGYKDNLTEALPILEKLKIPASIYVVSGQVGSHKDFYWDDGTSKADRGQALSVVELKQLDDSPWIEIGAHTTSHPHLAQLKLAQQTKEIIGSKTALEKYLSHTVSGFAYPFGASENDFTKVTEEICSEAGFDYALANIRGRVTKSSNLYALPRVLVRDGPPEEMFKAIGHHLPQ